MADIDLAVTLTFAARENDDLQTTAEVLTADVADVTDRIDRAEERAQALADSLGVPAKKAPRSSLRAVPPLVSETSWDDVLSTPGQV